MVIKKSQEAKSQKWVDRAVSLRSNLKNRTNQRRSRNKIKVEDSQEDTTNLNYVKNDEDILKNNSVNQDN